MDKNVQHLLVKKLLKKAQRQGYLATLVLQNYDREGFIEG